MSAAEQPWHEPGTVSLRPVLVVGAVLLLGAIVFLGYSCTHAGGAGTTFSDSAKRYPTGSVTYLSSTRSYLVRRQDSSFLSLSEVEASPDDRVTGCIIRYRSDLSSAGQNGVFRDDCHGTLFDRDGVAIQDSSVPMQRHPVQLEGDQLTVRFKACLSGGNDGAPEQCRE
jgi:hypothetical protein